MKKKRKINPMKIFCFISAIFVSICIFWYGGRTVYFYLDSKKVEKGTKTKNKDLNTLAITLKNNNENLKVDDKTYYFNGTDVNNYLQYSNILWRILKINEDNTITLISDKELVNLARIGDSIDNWLDNLENKLNNSNLLTNTKTCIDTVNEASKITCDKTEDKKLNILSIYDYIKTDANKGFINNNKYTYLINKSNEEEYWYTTENGEITKSDGKNIYGIKVTITIKENIEAKSGNGSKEDPYIIEDNNDIFASYVKIGNDTWRVYDYNEDEVKLVLNNNLKENSEDIKYIYSKTNYLHNDTNPTSLAYYLNKTYLNSLKYKSLIYETKYINGIYSSNNDYTLPEYKIDTKVSIPSINDIILNDIDGYFINTGLKEKGDSIYIAKSNATLSPKTIKNEALIVPCITIKRENIESGNGTEKDPYVVKEV